MSVPNWNAEMLESRVHASGIDAVHLANFRCAQLLFEIQNLQHFLAWKFSMFPYWDHHSLEPLQRGALRHSEFVADSSSGELLYQV